MPIKAENKHRYGSKAEWEATRERILARAGNQCELCAAPNGWMIIRDPARPAKWELPDGSKPLAKKIRVILTIAHLDPTYQDCGDKFLLALCQRCHLKIDVHSKCKARRVRTEASPA